MAKIFARIVLGVKVCKKCILTVYFSSSEIKWPQLDELINKIDMPFQVDPIIRAIT